MTTSELPVVGPGGHSEYVFFNVVFSGGLDRFDLPTLKARLAPYGLAYSDSELRDALSYYVGAGRLHATLDGWELIDVV